MKYVNLLLWVTQFGFSVLFPTVAFLWLGVFLQGRYHFGAWVVILLGILGILTSISTAKACWRSLKHAAEEAAGSQEKPVSFNTHK